MRIALLTMIEPSGAGWRAHLRVGATTLARQQLALVLAMGCERVICVAPAFDAEMLALQRMAEAARASFHVVSGARGLITLVSAADEVVALGEGLLAWPAIVTKLLGEAPVVVVQPIETGLAAGFERIDLNHAAAAAMKLPGRLVERLSQLPPDCEPFSALQRIALQAGVPQRLLPASAAEHGRWAMVRSEAEADAVEAAWIRLHISGVGVASPGVTLARAAVRRLGPALLHAGSGSRVVAGAALVLALLALVAGWFRFAVLGFGFCAVSWVVFVAATLLSRIEHESNHPPRHRGDGLAVFEAGFDLLLAALVTWSTPPWPGEPWVARGFAPLVLLGLARLVPPMLASAWARWLEDRALFAGVFAGAALLGWVGGATEIIALALLALGLMAARRHNREQPGLP